MTAQLTKEQQIDLLAAQMEKVAEEMKAIENGGDSPAAAPAPEEKVPAEKSEIITSSSFSDILGNANNREFFEDMKAKAQNCCEFMDRDSVKLWGRKIRTDELAGKPAYFYGFRISPSIKKPGTECLTLLLELESGERCVFFSGSRVLIKYSKQFADKFPCRGTIKKVNNYLVFE